MNLQKRIKAFAALGKSLANLAGLPSVISPPSSVNPFFTPREVIRALAAWGKLLERDNLDRWMQPYSFSPVTRKKEVLVITAGNIPLVGFHDFLSVLISGHRFKGKLSSRDNLLLPLIAEQLVAIEPDFRDSISFRVGEDDLPDAVIATGSTNSARYFEQDYGHLPHIFRKTRSSPAIIDSSETRADLIGLASDILEYYGLGCRSVSKIFVPSGYDFSILIQCLQEYNDLDPIIPYRNNLVYQKARLGLLNMPFIDAGQVILVEQPGFLSPVGVVFTEEYASQTDLVLKLSVRLDEIQCVVGNAPGQFDPIPFGTSQKPALRDYADGIDTLVFLNSLSDN